MRRFLLFALWMTLCPLLLLGQTPWAGGLNACQFGRMDLDGDGKKDLLVFDRNGNRLLCFLNHCSSGVIDYQYTNSYNDVFPKLTDWVVFADYDGDGLEDLFTYSKGWAGITVYRNLSASGSLRFEKVVDPYLTSLQGGGQVNILATNADYPAILDMDDDGDLDLLTFGVMGNFIEKHQNLSMELYGCRDSLVFERVDQCWGRVGENEENNLMYLDTCLFGVGLKLDPVRHRGATMAVKDLTGNGLPDLLLADVDYPGLTLLVNGGDEQHALMVSQETDFPPKDPVKLYSMPVPFFTDIDNDGVDDLLVSPFDPNPMACEGLNSVWLYLNHGTNQYPDYQLYTKSFLQDDMIDLGTGAFPVFADVDGDGLLDLVAGNIGNIDSVWYHYGSLQVHRSAQLTLFRNTGTAGHPVFEADIYPKPLMRFIDQTGLIPTYGDLDFDGQLEFLVGTSEGRLLLYDHDMTLLDDIFMVHESTWPAPCLFDVDQDGVTDLVVGNASGKLSYYQGVRQGDAIAFYWVTDFWGEVDVRDYQSSYFGYSVPTLFYYGGRLLLCVGSERGKLFLYEVSERPVFEEVSYLWGELCEGMPTSFGMRCSAALADLDGDGSLEVVVGNFSGGLQLFNAEIPVQFAVNEAVGQQEIELFPNPVSSFLNLVSKGDDLQSVMITDVYGRTLKSLRVSGKEVVVEVSDLVSGVYLARLVLETGFVNRIFLKR